MIRKVSNICGLFSGALLLLSAAGCSKNDAAVPNDFTSGEESWVNDPSRRQRPRP